VPLEAAREKRAEWPSLSEHSLRPGVQTADKGPDSRQGHLIQGVSLSRKPSRSRLTLSVRTRRS
jgi:hypothetical protein